jgi:hypothetical protein
MATHTITVRTYDGGGSLADLDADPTIGVVNTSDDNEIVADGTDMTHASTGVYTYELTFGAAEAADTVTYGTTYTSTTVMVYAGNTYTKTEDFTTRASTAATSTLERDYDELVSVVSTEFPEYTGQEYDIIRDGYMLFLYPPEVTVNGVIVASHQWSFLSPTATLNTITEYSTGTVTVVEDDATVTLASGTWPTWVDDDSVIIITDGAGDTHTCSVSSRTDGTYIELASAWSETGAAGLSYVIHYHPYDNDLPAAFGGLVGNQILISSTTEWYQPIRIVTPEEIEGWRLGTDITSSPKRAAVRPKEFTPATGMRWELILDPTPDDDYTLQYRYNVNPNAVATGVYPIGGVQHAQTVKAAVLAAAELRALGGHGNYYEAFLRRLQSSVRQDMRFRSANLGPITDTAGITPYFNRLSDTVYFGGVDTDT